MKITKLYFSIILFISLIIFLTTISFAEFSNYIWSSKEELTAMVSNNITPNYTDDKSNPLNLDCGSSILIEQTTGKVLYSYNSHEKLRPASVTKIMSILLIMEAIENGKINYDTPITCSENAAAMGGSQIWLDTTETLTVEEMLKAICVVSANDCVVAMAEHLGGTEEGFVEMMNEKAKQLGMNDTTFKNCHGIDEDGHVTSAYDIAIMSRELMTKHPSITNYTTIWMDSLRDGKSELVNTNKLIRNYTGATGLKTGSTSVALYNLSATATRNGLSLIAVIMKAPSTKIRFAEAQKLLDYGFNTYEYREFAKKDETLNSISVNKGINSNVEVVFAEDAGMLLKKGEAQNISQSVDLPESIMAPITQGQKLGEATYLNNGESFTVDLIAKNSVESLGFLNVTKMVYGKWFTLFR